MSRATIEQIVVAKLRSNFKNARSHSKKQVGQIADSIRRFGFTVAGPFLQLDGRKSMRSLADALAKMREVDRLSGGEKVEINSGMKLPNGSRTGVVGILGPIRQDDHRCAIWMPPSATFSAATSLGERHV